jgi:hypothetical protein
MENSEMWCWRKMEIIVWYDRVRTEMVLHRVKCERNIMYTLKTIKATWIGRKLRVNCLV